MDKLQEQLNNLKLEVAMLKKDVSFLTSINKALALSLSELSPESAQRTEKLLDAMAAFSQFADDEPAGRLIMNFHEELKALLSYGDASVVLSLLAAQAADVGREKLAALHEWNALATEDELAQDIVELLKKFQGRKQQDQ